MIQDKILRDINIDLLYKRASDLNGARQREVILSPYERKKFMKIKNEVESGDFVSLEDFLKENE